MDGLLRRVGLFQHGLEMAGLAAGLLQAVLDLLFPIGLVQLFEGDALLGQGQTDAIHAVLLADEFFVADQAQQRRIVFGDQGQSLLPDLLRVAADHERLGRGSGGFGHARFPGGRAQIILNGADWFTSIGTPKSTGTKVFALGGKINNTGLVEVPMGTKLRDIIYNIGGGIPNGKAFKAVQTGGPSGGCLPASMLDTPIDYDNLIAAGSMMGSGGMIVMDEDNCMVDIARFFLDFTVDESCGKCTPCRIGTQRMLEILERIVEGKGEPGDIEKLETLGKNIKETALCGLGQTAPNPVLSTIKYFRDEYEAHIYEKRCPAHHCQKLLNYVITGKCRGCTACTKVCPAGAISGTVKEQHKIDTTKCLKCGACMEKCRFGAIEKH